MKYRFFETNSSRILSHPEEYRKGLTELLQLTWLFKDNSQTVKDGQVLEVKNGNNGNELFDIVGLEKSAPDSDHDYRVYVLPRQKKTPKSFC